MRPTRFTLAIIALSFLAAFHNSLARNECSHDANDDSIDKVTGCPRRDVSVVMLSFPPFAMLTDDGSGQVSAHGIAFNYLAESFGGCCKDGVTLTLSNDLNTDTESESFQEALLHADIIFPVTEKLETKLTLSGIGYSFHEIIKSHAYVLIGRIDHYNWKAMNLVLDSLYDSWPIFATTFLLAGIAGIFIWALEYHVKNDEFPCSFTRGSYEGFWWAFISMTTVGYGDKTPRSIIGRLFGVLWILLGLIVTAMFTATVTSALTHSSSPEYTNALEGMDVAVLEQDSEAEAEARYIGAIPRVYEQIEDLDQALLDEEVEGIFMERLQAYHYFKDKTEDDNLRVFDTLHTQISYKMALKINTTCAFLQENFCFRRRLENPLIGPLIKQYTKPLKVFRPSVDTEGLLSGSSSHTGILLLAILGIFLGLVTLGLFVDYFIIKSGKRRCKPRSRETSAFDVSFPIVDVTLRQLEKLEQDLEKLSTQVQTMKENLEVTDRQQRKCNTDNILKLTEVNSSVS